MASKPHQPNRQFNPALCYSNTGGRSAASPSVIIIGGGMAGIAAARALHDASFQVTLLESRDRIGGRVCTDYSFGFPVDLGASWLHGVSEENPLAPIIGRLGLPLYRTSGDNSVLYDHDLESYALYDMAGNKVPQELVTKVGEDFKSIMDEANQVRAENSKDMSVSRAISVVFDRRPDLRLDGLPHKVLQWYLCRMEGWFAADADTISLKCWDQEELLPGGHGLMVRGYFPVINTLAKGLDIRLGHRVTNIVRRYNGVKVTVENGRTFVADAAIVATPLGVLKSNCIKFEPRLPEWKETAIVDLGVGVENKIILHFKEVFWPKVEFLGVVAETSYECSYFLNLHKATGHAVLVYMPAGQLARDIEKMSDEVAANFAFTQLKKILPDASDPVNTHIGLAQTAAHAFQVPVPQQPSSTWSGHPSRKCLYCSCSSSSICLPVMLRSTPLNEVQCQANPTSFGQGFQQNLNNSQTQLQNQVELEAHQQQRMGFEQQPLPILSNMFDTANENAQQLPLAHCTYTNLELQLRTMPLSPNEAS